MPFKDPAKRREYNRDQYHKTKGDGRHLNNARALRGRLRSFLNALKDEPCLDCGNRFPPECMDFDHVRGTKRANVGALSAVSESIILAEIEKCDLVCSNCHRIRTASRRRATMVAPGDLSQCQYWPVSKGEKVAQAAIFVAVEKAS